MDLDKIATKGFSSELRRSITVFPAPQDFFANCTHLEEMHCHEKPFVAFFVSLGPRYGL